MFRLYLEYARLVSPDRDNGKMVRSPAHTRPLRMVRKANEQDFVLEGQHAVSGNEGPAPGVHVEEGAILDVTDK